MVSVLILLLVVAAPLSVMRRSAPDPPQPTSLASRWELILVLYGSGDRVKIQLAEALFAQLTEQQKELIRATAGTGRWPLQVRYTTQTNRIGTNALVQPVEDLERIERMRQKIIIYLEDVRRDALMYQHKRTAVALGEATRFIRAYTLCKRDPSPEYVEMARRRGEDCLKVLSELYGSK
jgi:hypothetical protein